jgi:hypothetical protein
LWKDYAQWHLGLTEGVTDETKARYAFVFGDLRCIHRSGVIGVTIAQLGGGTGDRACRSQGAAAPDKKTGLRLLRIQLS